MHYPIRFCSQCWEVGNYSSIPLLAKYLWRAREAEVMKGHGPCPGGAYIPDEIDGAMSALLPLTEDQKSLKFLITHVESAL